MGRTTRDSFIDGFERGRERAKKGSFRRGMKDLLGLHDPSELEELEETEEEKTEESEEKSEDDVKTADSADTPSTSADNPAPADVPDGTDAKGDKPEAEDNTAPAEKLPGIPPVPEGEEFAGQSAGSAPVTEQMATNEVVIGTNKIQAQRGDDKMKVALDIVDLSGKYEGEKLPIAAAQLYATKGESLNPKLAEIVKFAIINNKEVREFIASQIPGLIKEFPDGAKAYSEAVNSVARDIRVKPAVWCPVDRKIYDSEDTALDNLEKGDIISYSKGVWKFKRVWLRTDSDGCILEQDGTLTEGEVRKLVSTLPKEIQAETYVKLNLEPPKAAKGDSNKGAPRKGNTGKKNSPGKGGDQPSDAG